MAIERVIGIDFGTSTSVIKIKTYKDNEPMDAREMADYVRFDNKATLPTLVYKTDDGQYLIGYEAEYAAVKGKLFQNFKLNLISEDAELKNTAVLFTTKFFEYMYRVYSEQRSIFPRCDIETTYISYPAKWPESLRDLMINIAKNAGFKNVVGIDEPTAAIHTVMVQKKDEFTNLCRDKANILMIDMGAGTTDIVLCNYDANSKEKIRVLNTWPKIDDNCLFGGREIDEILCNYVREYLVNCGLPNANGFESKYLDKCKSWKESNISPTYKNADGVVKYCGFIDTLLTLLDVDSDFPPITRYEFEKMLEGYLQQMPRMINNCIDDIGYDRGEIDFVILTGGHSQWYFVEDIVSGELKKYGEVSLPKILNNKNRILHLAVPQETVALGMVYQRLNVELSNEISKLATTLKNVIQTQQIKYGSNPNNENTWISYRDSQNNWRPYIIKKDKSKNMPLPCDLYFNQAFTVDSENDVVYWTDTYKGDIHKMNLNSGKKEVITNPLNTGFSYSETQNTMERTASLCVSEGYIYCLGRPKYAANNECYLFKFREGQKPIRLDIRTIWSFCEYKGYLYFMQPAGDYKDLYRLRLSSSNSFDIPEKLCRMPKYAKNIFYIFNDYLYYSSGHVESVFKMKLDGTDNYELMKMPKDCNLYDYPYNIDFINGFARIYKYKSMLSFKQIFYKIRLDGTGLQEI